MSLKSRIREAQSEAVKRTKRARRNASDKEGAPIFDSKDGRDDETTEAMPTVEEIRVALLRKSSNGKNTQ